ncbi:MAG: TRAP transporter substrate-binding protein [Nitratireductor sp.]
MIKLSRRTVTASFAGLLAYSMLSCATASAQTTLTMSSWVPPKHFVHTEILAPYAAKIEEVTQGRVKVTILPAPLGTPPQHWELARTGVADITWGNFTYEPDRFVSMWFAELPFAGTNAQAQSRALWRTYEKHLKDNAAYQGVKMLGVGMFGGGQLHHGKMTINDPTQMKDQKFRMGGPIQQQMLESFGAIPVAAPATKAYEMLDSGVIDGSLHTMESVVNFRLTDSLKHHTYFPEGFYDATFFIVMNGPKWDSLSEEDKAAIDGISGETLSADWGKQFDIQNPAATEKLKAEGHEIAEASPAFIEALHGIYDKMIADWETAAKAAGVADPAAMRTDYANWYKELAK